MIGFYRLTGIPILDFYLGTFALAMMAAVIGELTISICFFFNRKHIEKSTGELTRMQNLSIMALKRGDGKNYRAFNRDANDLFGRVFFYQIAMGSASLWPVPFALSWMQMRFSRVALPLPFALPLTGETVGYPFVFIPLYILARILFEKLKPYLPYFRRIQGLLRTHDGDSGTRGPGDQEILSSQSHSGKERA
jgi:hypothetical protein